MPKRATPVLLPEERIAGLCRSWSECDCECPCWSHRVQFVVGGSPKAWQSYRRDASGRAYTPRPILQYKLKVGWSARLAVSQCSYWPLNGLYRYSARYYFSDGRTEGDVENYHKPVKDALQGILYTNDKQVQAHGESAKFRVQSGDECAIIRVEQLLLCHELGTPAKRVGRG